MYFRYSVNNEVKVYVDGSCLGNGTRFARAGVGVWFGYNHPLNLGSTMPGVQTNQNAEIYAAVRALEIILNNGEHSALILTDSDFLCKCVNWYMHKWKNNGWITNTGRVVANKGMLIRLDRLLTRMHSYRFIHVRGHEGNRGNEEADRLARQAALQ